MEFILIMGLVLYTCFLIGWLLDCIKPMERYRFIRWKLKHGHCNYPCLMCKYKKYCIKEMQDEY